jgi:hypothetical protein
MLRKQRDHVLPRQRIDDATLAADGPQLDFYRRLASWPPAEDDPIALGTYLAQFMREQSRTVVR